MIQKLRTLFEKYWDIVSYLFFGVLTTVVNYLIYLPVFNCRGQQHDRLGWRGGLCLFDE